MIEKLNTGIVLHKWVYEDEHIVKILTEGGNVLSLKAKGLDAWDSKNRMSLHIFNTVEVQYFTSHTNTRDTGRLKTASVIKEFKGEHSSQNFTYIEVIRNIIAYQEHNSMLTYKCLVHIINMMESNMMTFQHLLNLMIITLRQNGYVSVVDRCAKCGSNQNIKAFEIYEGGLICNQHEEANKYKLPKSTLMKLIEIHSLVNPMECRDLDFTPEEVSKIQSMYKQFMENQLALNLFMLDRKHQYIKH